MNDSTPGLSRQNYGLTPSTIATTEERMAKGWSATVLEIG